MASLLYCVTVTPCCRYTVSPLDSVTVTNVSTLYKRIIMLIIIMDQTYLKMVAWNFPRVMSKSVTETGAVMLFSVAGGRPMSCWPVHTLSTEYDSYGASCIKVNNYPPPRGYIRSGLSFQFRVGIYDADMPCRRSLPFYYCYSNNLYKQHCI